jgi:hypothetical protein
MSAANPNPMEKSMVSVLVVENAGGGRRCHFFFTAWGAAWQNSEPVASKNHSGPGYKYSRFFG